MSDVQPMVWAEDLNAAIAFYRDQLGFSVNVFGTYPESGEPLVAGARFEDAFILLSNDGALRGADGGNGAGPLRMYFHLDGSVDDLFVAIRDQPDFVVLDPPTDQFWGDRTLIVQDPWRSVLVFSNPVEGHPTI